VRDGHPQSIDHAHPLFWLDPCPLRKLEGKQKFALDARNRAITALVCRQREVDRVA
jgi:hypothetical protein